MLLKKGYENGRLRTFFNRKWTEWFINQVRYRKSYFKNILMEFEVV